MASEDIRTDTELEGRRSRDVATTASRGDRSKMLRAMRALETALAYGVPKREQAWMTKVRASMAVLEESMRHQRHEFQAKDGILQQIVEDKPRLANQVDQLRDLHSTALKQLGKLLAQTEAHKTSTSGDVSDVRRELAEVMGAIRRLQGNESDLIYEAYQVDLGGGD